MILKQLKVVGFRPFYEQVSLDITPSVTVLTGANDAGKSAILDIMKRLSEDISGKLDDANIDFRGEPPKVWNKNTDIQAIVTFVASSIRDYLRQPVNRGWEVDVRLRPTMNERHVVEIRDSAGKPVTVKDSRLARRLTVIDLGSQPKLNTTLTDTGRTESDNKLLELAFGANPWPRLVGLNDQRRVLECENASEDLNRDLAYVKPTSLQVEFRVSIESHDPLKILVGLQDNFGGRAFPHLRGAGYQKLMQLMFFLLTIDVESQHVILIYDEPENSLHADAQHSFRSVLESFAEHDNIQVIFATHSPAMINPNRPESLRLLTRDKSESGYATTRVDNKPYIESNYQSVRAQLGILPADSLMFASIGIIAEGPTERLALARLIDKLISEGDPNEHPNLKLHWHLSFVISAGGTGEFRRWIEFAKAQNVSVIALLDGDSIKLENELKQENQDIQVLAFDEGTEIEEVVDEHIYFEALELVVPGNHKDMKKNYDAWLSQSQFAKGKMFSKRVEMWLKDELNTGLDKPKVMAKAIKLAQMDQICWTKINDLVASIREAADNL